MLGGSLLSTRLFLRAERMSDRARSGKQQRSREMNSLRGHFLVAAPHQLDPNFVQTVILVVKHTGRGALGVIVNCPWEEGDYPVKKPNLGRIFPTEAHSCFGGPVTGPLMAVHTKQSLAEIQLLPGVFFSDKEENVLALMWQNDQPYKVFFGYAGWGPGQLEYEVEQGIWRVVPATPEQLFSDSSNLWQQLSSQASRMQLRGMFNLKHIPADPLLN
jgi:putative transcriptional regulator